VILKEMEADGLLRRVNGWKNRTIGFVLLKRLNPGSVAPKTHEEIEAWEVRLRSQRLSKDGPKTIPFSERPAPKSARRNLRAEIGAQEQEKVFEPDPERELDGALSSSSASPAPACDPPNPAEAARCDDDDGKVFSPPPEEKIQSPEPAPAAQAGEIAEVRVQAEVITPATGELALPAVITTAAAELPLAHGNAPVAARLAVYVAKAEFMDSGETARKIEADLAWFAKMIAGNWALALLCAVCLATTQSRRRNPIGYIVTLVRDWADPDRGVPPDVVETAKEVIGEMQAKLAFQVAMTPGEKPSEEVLAEVLGEPANERDLVYLAAALIRKLRGRGVMLEPENYGKIKVRRPPDGSVEPMTQGEDAVLKWLKPQVYANLGGSSPESSKVDQPPGTDRESVPEFRRRKFREGIKRRLAGERP
jgi:hypothetical protein